jgi:hypothetical protein
MMIDFVIMLKFGTCEATNDKIDECKKAIKKMNDLGGAEGQCTAVKTLLKDMTLVNQQLSNSWHLIVYGPPRIRIIQCTHDI